MRIRGGTRGSARRGRFGVEGLESRQLLTASIVGSVELNLTGAGLPGRTVFVDLKGDGRLDPSDPSAVTGADGSYSIGGLTPGASPATDTIRLLTSPGEVPIPASESVAVTDGQTAQATPLKVQPTSAILPLSVDAAPFGSGQPDLATAEVTALYKVVLGRAPDSSGLADWVGTVRGGLPMTQVAADFLSSPEYESRVVAANYRNFLGRAGSSGEIKSWVARMQSGWDAERVADGFLGSPEYSRLHTSASDFVQSLYANVLGRQGSSSEVSSWTSLLAGGATRAAVALGFIGSDEADARGINGLDAVFLDRAATPLELSNGLASLRSGSPLVSLVLGPIVTSEFSQDARPSVSPASPVTLSLANRFDYAFGKDGILYITDGSNVDRYDLATSSFLTPFVVGGQLGGIDVSPDGSRLAVADQGRNGFVLVSTATGAVTPVQFTDAGTYEHGTYAVAWGADDSVLITSNFTGSGWTPLRRYDAATGAITTIAMVDQSSRLSPSADRQTIGVAEPNASNGPMDVYGVAASKFVARAETGAFNSTIATSPDGTEFVVPTYFGAYVYQRVGTSLNQVATIGTYASNGPLDAVFSPTGRYLFTTEYGTQGIAGVKVYDTANWTQIASLDATPYTWSTGYPAF